ncbi:MAG: CocE/NonD family hydrolase C-terminal non-catalytic domain-containing protein [Thermoplasmatota archaeon]
MSPPARPETDMRALLWDQAPNGAMERVAPGFLNLQQRDGRDTSKDVPTGTAMKLALEFYATAHVFETGHRVVLTLAGSDHYIFPAWKFAPTWTVSLDPANAATLWAPGFTR